MKGGDTTYRLDHFYSGQSFRVEIPFLADSIRFDPEQWLVSAHNIISLERLDEIPLTVSPNPATDYIMVNAPRSVERLELFSDDGENYFTPEKTMDC